jgi:60 kDa SS-A/Ro ribonucleoprotein
MGGTNADKAAAAAGALEALVERDHIKTAAGGMARAVPALTQLQRYLVLGTAGGSFYSPEEELDGEVAGRLLEALLLGDDGLDGPRAVAEIVAISQAGRAAKPGPAIKALTYCAKLGDAETRAAAYAAMPKICRTPTHLFEFVALSEELAGATSGWGRAMRRAVGAWYTGKHPKALAQAVTKYRQRDGWSHCDVLRLCHASPAGDAARQLLFRYVTKGLAAAKADLGAGADGVCAEVLTYLEAVETCRASASAEDAAGLIRSHGLVREHVPSGLLGDAAVWHELLLAGRGMPLTALIRNLGKISSVGLFEQGAAKAAAVAMLSDGEALAQARVHPFSALLAQATYSRGKGVLGSLEWPVVPEIVAALDTAFLESFKGVAPTGKRIVQAVDVSGSMAWSPVVGSKVLNAREGAAALAWLTSVTELHCHTLGFGNEVCAVDLEGAASLADATGRVSALPNGPLDVVLVLDCTGSMGAWIEEAKAKLLAITAKLREWFSHDGELRVGFVGYRDINDTGQQVVCALTEDFAKVQAVIEVQDASGGGDTPEDVAGAFAECLKLSWREGAAKLMVHIADAPCHGTRFHGKSQLGDSYPRGDPGGKDPEKQVERLAAKGVDYVFFDTGGPSYGYGGVAAGGKQDTICGPMCDILKAAYDATPGRRTLPMAVEHLGGAADRLEASVLQCAERSAYGGGTDCAAPILWALEHRLACDAFVVYTDSETSPGPVTVGEAIRRYRDEMALPEARVVVVALSASRFTVAEPDDPRMLDMAGFDAASPQILAAFLEGAI